MEKLTSYERVFGERYEKNISSEFTLPEYLPNASKILKVSVIPTVERCECTNGIEVRGRAAFSVLYASDFRDTIKCAVFSAEFEHSFGSRITKDDLGEGGFVECTVNALAESSKVQNPRRLSLSCTLVLDVSATAQREIELFDIEENDSIKKRTAKVETLCIMPLGDCEMRIEENVDLDEGLPGIKEIVFAECAIGPVESKIKDGVYSFTGNALFSCLYHAQDSGENSDYVSFSKTVPFTVSSNADSVPEDATLLCKAYTTKVTAESSVNSYGDCMSIRAEICGKISGRVYHTRSVNVCEDVFCTKHDCNVEMQRLPTDIFVDCLSDSAEICENVRISLGGITEVVKGDVEITEVRTELIDGRVAVVASAILRICGTNEQGSLESASSSFTFRQTAEESFDSRFEKYRLDSNISVNHPECRIENGEVRCCFRSHLTTAVTATSRVNAAVALELDDTTEYKRDKSRYVIYYPCAEDTVWSIAKKYKVAPKTLCEMNGIPNNERLEKKCVVIPR